MPKLEMSLSDVVRHPATLAGTVTAVLGGLLNLPLLGAAWASFYASSGQLFGALAVLSFLAEHLPALQNRWVVVPMVVVGAVVLHRRASTWYENFSEKLDQ